MVSEQLTMFLLKGLPKLALLSRRNYLRFRQWLSLYNGHIMWIPKCQTLRGFQSVHY